MGLINLFKKRTKVTLFTTPSHGQRFFIFSKFRQFYKYDISETDVHNPQEALFCAQKSAANIYKTKSTHFLINGSTSGVIAAVLAVLGRGKREKGKGKRNSVVAKQREQAKNELSDPVNRSEADERSEAIQKVLIGQNVHCCHKNAVVLAGAEPVFYEVEKDEDWGIYTAVIPEIIEKKLKEEKNIKAVIITSPTYEGVVSDIKKIQEICKKYSAYLIVDEAHGALYPFSDALPTSAVSFADFTIQSLHKTAGGLNPTALLHCNVDGVDVDGALALITTTSPSYPLLASIEKNINFLNSKRGRKMISDLIKNIGDMKNRLSNCQFFEGDQTKIVLKKANMSGFALSEKLFQKGIEDERANEKSVLLLTGIGTDLKKLKKLEKVLKLVKGEVV